MVQRVEVITGKERRRRWSEEEKRRLVAETWAPGATVAHVARRNEVAESCLYIWRRQFGNGDGAERRTVERPLLIPVMVEDEAPAPAAAAPAPEAAAALPARAVVTLADGTRLEVGPDYPTAALKALIGALRRRQ